MARLDKTNAPWTLPMALATAAITLGAVLSLSRFAPWLGREARRQAEWIGGLAALAMLDLLFLQREGTLSHYVTVFWGLSAIAIFVAGLAARSRPLRVTGLIGLALCLPRVFVIDIRSTLYRIVAFMVLGGVLIGVGFLYYRFRDWIERLDEDEADAAVKSNE
jgi:uncharacterized membrane protein